MLQDWISKASNHTTQLWTKESMFLLGTIYQSSLCEKYRALFLNISASDPSNALDPCGDRNMVAVSNPSHLDDSLVFGKDAHNKIILHAYGAGNEPYDSWKGMDRFLIYFLCFGVSLMT